MSKVISLRFRDPQVERLQRVARRLGRTPSETASLLLDESLRMAEYGLIVFRDSAVGRQAFLTGSPLAVWEVVSLVSAFGGDAEATAGHLELPPSLVLAALRYAEDFPDEIDAAMADNAAYDPERVSRMLPQLETFPVGPSAEPPA